jgi:hypothetical protein
MDDLRKFLGKDFPPESLPTVEEAITLVEQHRTSIDKETAEDERTTALATLRQAHQARRDALTQERQRLEARQGERVAALTAQQRAARDALRHRHLEQRKLVAHERRENRPRGLAAFLGRVTGVEALRAHLHKRQDARRLKAFGEQLLAMKVTQTRARIDQELQHRAEALEQARREKALTRIERREIVALLRDLRASQRELARGNSDGLMPSLEGVVRRDRRAQVRLVSMAPTHRVGEARDSFEDASTRSPTELPNLLAAFARATQARRVRDAADDKAPALDRMTRPSRDREQPTAPLERGPEPGRDSGHERD